MHDQDWLCIEPLQGNIDLGQCGVDDIAGGALNRVVVARLRARLVVEGDRPARMQDKPLRPPARPGTLDPPGRHLRKGLLLLGNTFTCLWDRYSQFSRQRALAHAVLHAERNLLGRSQTKL